jgi:hypothetical protein
LEIHSEAGYRRGSFETQEKIAVARVCRGFP